MISPTEKPKSGCNWINTPAGCTTSCAPFIIVKVIHAQNITAMPHQLDQQALTRSLMGAII